MNDGYASIERMFHMSDSSERAQEFAEREYLNRLNGYSTFRTGVELDGHEVFALAFRELQTQMDAIRDRELVIADLWRGVPARGKGLVLYELIAAEIVQTNSIEGIHTTRREVDEAFAARADESSHKRLVEFVRLYVELVAKETAEMLAPMGVKVTDERGVVAMPTTLAGIRELYDRVTAGEIDAKDLPDGELFRSGTTGIYDGAGRLVRQGAATESQIQVLLTQWLQLAANDNIPIVLRACLCHYIFESIHPFYDGNGRTGRFLLALQLRDHLSLPTTLSLSAAIERQKAKYYKAFDETAKPLNCSDASLFCMTMVELIRDAQETLIGELQEHDGAMRRSRGVLDEMVAGGEISALQRKILEWLAQTEMYSSEVATITRTETRETLGVGEDRAVRVLEGLVDAGMLIRSGARPIKYALSDEMRERLLVE
ncbi:Fic family protein [Bifidobacterium choloepi]|uniref:Fic family protein n=1 Tax=Bifidobacterium choloepi TaxID=2614131 RepID=A0A6I5NF06_9BIFI|nr:Fic family protein [Bifidobacterium choloepi]NEG69924.1 Fic family protein [Bifidobacterium choloepi]